MDRFANDRPRQSALLAAAALLVPVVAAACGGAPAGPPAIVLDRAACDACGMLISAPEYAAAYRAGRRTAVFDDIGCLLRGLDEAGLATAADLSAAPEPDRAGDTAEVWFLDADQRWITAADAVFVRSPALETPMGGGIRAFADRTEAERAAAAIGGDLIDSFAELRAGAKVETRHRGGPDDSSS